MRAREAARYVAQLNLQMGWADIKMQKFTYFTVRKNLVGLIKAQSFIKLYH